MAYSYEFEPINGNFFQTIAYYYEVFKPINGSWLQAICEENKSMEPINGSWLHTFAKIIYDSSELKYPINPQTGDYFYDEFDNPISVPFELINGNFWQSILYYSLVDEQYFLDNFELNVSFPINGSWANTYYQYLRNSNEGDIVKPGYILVTSSPTWSGSNTFTRFPSSYSIIDSELQTDGNGIGAFGKLFFNSQTTINSASYVSGGYGYKVGDTLTIPSLTIPEITGDIVFTVLEVLEY